MTERWPSTGLPILELSNLQRRWVAQPLNLYLHLDLAARATAMQIGLVAYFLKPFNDEQFLAAVHDALATPKSVKP
jgi:DNA-binding NtrC family response regulator